MDKTEKLKALIVEAKALDELIGGQADGATEEQAEQLEKHATDVQALQTEIEAAEKQAKALATSRATIAAGSTFLESSPGRITAPDVSTPISSIADVSAALPPIPATARRFGRLKNFHGPNAEQRAFRFGMLCLAARGRPAAIEWCGKNGIPLIQSAHSEGVNVAGGVTVPEEFDNDMIDLKEQYGVARQYARTVPMTSDTMRRLRRTGGLTAYAVGEAGAGTESTKSWDQITLTAKDWMVLATYSQDLNEDSAISIGDDLAGEIAYAFANKEDECLFNGDGTSTYHGIVGIAPKFLGLSATRANIAGLVVGAGNLFSELTLANFEDVVGKLPTYGDTPNTKWFVHKLVWSTMAKLMRAAGGNTAADLQSGLGPQFLGYDVVFTQVMPKVDANDQVAALLGDLRLAADFGDRRQNTVSFSDTATVGSVSMFETNQLAIRGTERFDINVHDIGNASGTAASRVAGPVVGLLMAAS